MDVEDILAEIQERYNFKSVALFSETEAGIQGGMLIGSKEFADSLPAIFRGGARKLEADHAKRYSKTDKINNLLRQLYEIVPDEIREEIESELADRDAHSKEAVENIIAKIKDANSND